MSSKKIILNRKKPGIFTPSLIRSMKQSRGDSVLHDFGKLADTNILSTSSFRYDVAGSAIKSTQELPVDFSNFENHTFFDSAVSKVNVAFNDIVNSYPFDGSRKEVEAFQDGLTGFENYVLDIFPKNVGFLLFSGTAVNENPAGGYSADLGTYISVLDQAGKMFPGFSKNDTGKAVLDPRDKSFSIEAQVYLPDEANDNQIIFQKRYTDPVIPDSYVGYSIGVSGSLLSATTGTIIFSIVSGSGILSLSGTIEKGKFSHISAVFDRSSAVNNLKFYVNSKLAATSAYSYKMNSIITPSVNFIIGSGSSFNVDSSGVMGFSERIFTPRQTFSGALDDIRFYHKLRNTSSIDLDYRRNIFAQDNVALYFKLDEPEGDYSLPSVVLDSSGNSLHSVISNFKSSLKLTGSSGVIQNNMPEQEPKYSPILYPSYPTVSSLNSRLLTSASCYDCDNPNLITKLIPQHYLTDGQVFEGFENVTGSMASPYTASSIPGSGKLGSGQILASFIFIWAKFFDEIKMFLDHFSNVVHIDYDTEESVANKFLPAVAKYYGIDLPAIFSTADISQLIYGYDIRDSAENSVNSLNYVQNEIWRRILINIRDIINSKGTRHAIDSLLRSAGINVENVFTIREYGGPLKRSLEGQRVKRTEVSTLLNMSGSLSSVPSSTSHQGIPAGVPFVMSPFLSSSRIETGYPNPVGTMVDKVTYYPNGISNAPSDGLFTSGSFTYEALYRFQPIRSRSLGGRVLVTDFSQYQSLVRFNVTGTQSPASSHGLIANLVVDSGSISSSLHLYVRSSAAAVNEPNNPILSMSLGLVSRSMFDGDVWNVSFGRYRSDDPRNLSGTISSSYFIRCGKSDFGTIEYLNSTMSYFDESPYDKDLDVWQNIVSPTHNASGSFFTIGSQSIASVGSTATYLNNSSFDNIIRSTKFEGRVGQIRFWSEGLYEKSWNEHVRNFGSLGTKNPQINFNFMTQRTGSFQRLRIDASTDQRITQSNSSGDITIFDFSQATHSGSRGAPWRSGGDISNMSFHLSGTGFELNKQIIVPQQFNYTILSPVFDMRASDEKIRIRSYLSSSNFLNSPYSTTPPVYEVLPSEQPDDDNRFTIDYSTVRALNDDMIKLFSSLEFFDDAMGQPNLLFSSEYPDIDSMREVYFHRLTGKPDFRKFLDFFKWFDKSFGYMISQLIPRKVNFLGINFVIESHLLERHKFKYLYDEIYLKSHERDSNRGNLLLSLFSTSLKKI